MKRLVGLISLIATVCITVPLLGSTGVGKPQGISIGKVDKKFNPADGKIFVLVVGNDARTGNPDASRADSMHLVGINTKTMKAGILNFPRDCWVNVPGHGSMKMNESLYAGGPDLLVQTMEGVTGIQIDYYVMTGFQGFRHVVRGLRGVRVNVPVPMFDPGGSGANLKSGPQELDPEEALAFNRTRKVLALGDIDRSTNQGLFLMALLRQLHRDVAKTPGAIFDWLALGRKWTRFDVRPEELYRLAVLATQVNAGDVKAQTIPVSIGSVGLASVVFISSGADSLFAKFKRTGTL